MKNTDCQFDRIWSHLGEEPLDTSVRDYLDSSVDSLETRVTATETKLQTNISIFLTPWEDSPSPCILELDVALEFENNNLIFGGKNL